MGEITKPISSELASMIKKAVESLLDFATVWKEVKEKGASEGFTEKELQEIARPLLKEKLNTKQVWYLFHKEEHNARTTSGYHQKRSDAAINRTNDDKKDIDKSHTSEVQPDQTEHKLRDVGIVLDEEEDNEPQDPNQVPDAVFTAKKLAKALDEINVLNVKLEQEQKTVAQLQEVVKKDAFKPANESMNVFHKKNIAIPMAQTELRKLMGQGWHFINLTAEFVS